MRKIFLSLYKGNIFPTMLTRCNKISKILILAKRTFDYYFYKIITVLGLHTAVKINEHEATGSVFAEAQADTWIISDAARA